MTDKSAAAIREFAEKQFPLSKELKKEVLYNQIQQAKQNECLSDLTALISEGYYPKKFVEWLLKQDSYPQDNGGTYFLVNGVAGDDATLLFYHWNKYIKKENER